MKGFVVQLREACKAGGARWAAWGRYSPAGWKIEANFGLSKARSATLLSFIADTKVASWLAGAFSSGRLRFCKTGDRASGLGCTHLFVFPNLPEQRVLLVGADELDRSSENLFRVLSLAVFPPESQEASRSAGKEDTVPVMRPFEQALETSYQLDEVLQGVLEFLTGLVSSNAALLSVRSGDTFRVTTTVNCPATLRGEALPIGGNPLLSRLISKGDGVLLNDLLEEGEHSAGVGLAGLGRSWIAAPLIVGKRVIGHLEFSAEALSAFKPQDLKRIVFQAKRLAYVVENAIVFSEATRYLEQLALLNDLSSAASFGGDTDEIARRIAQRLKRTFNAAQARIFLRSTEDSLLREYGPGSRSRAQFSSLEGSLVSHVIETGLPERIYLPVQSPASSLSVSGRDTSPVSAALAAPLKYRGKVIGAIVLQNSEPQAYSPQDEQLLVLIAGHLAGLFENMRLSDEARERARNLGLIHQVVRRVVGLTDVHEVARTAADLMVKDLVYEMVVVSFRQDERRIWIAGPGEDRQVMNASQLENASLGLESLQRISDLADEVMNDGKSRLLADIPGGSSHPAGEGWVPAAEMCVPLRQGTQIFGAINVFSSQKGAFTESDLLALEALAGVLSSVILSVRRYEQIQDSFRQLHAVRESAIDLAADLDLDGLLRRVVHRARELVGAEGAELGLLDEKEGVIRVLVSDSPWSDSAGKKIELLAGVAGRVAGLGEPLVVPDYNTWNGRLHPEADSPYRTVAGVPLKFRGNVIGTLTLMDSRPNWSFKPEHIRLLELLAPQATVWIRNARLYQELEERIEAQRVAEMRLVRSARLAAVGEMAAGVAHELNNPLTTVIGFVELVLDELVEDSSHYEDLSLVLREAQRARGVVRRLLDFSRPVENQRVRSDINEMVEDVLALVRHLARTGGVEISLYLAEDLPWVSVDPGHIKQVLLNLIHNAIQAMPHGGVMSVATGCIRRENEDWLSITVQDNGVGISSENLVRIFEPFFTTRAAGSGTGLGLSVSYGIVNEHGGSIEVESKLGKGSTFTIFLPVNPGEKDG